MIERKQFPSRQELSWFGLIVLCLFAIVGALVWWHAGSLRAAQYVWIAGAALTAAFYAFRPLRLPLYHAWMTLVAPIGWLISHVLLGTVYYIILTPIGMILRLIGNDPMDRDPNRARGSYWIARQPQQAVQRYFRQL
jgi:hypothetical protein